MCDTRTAKEGFKEMNNKTPKQRTEFHLTNKTNKTGFLGVKLNKRNNCYEAYIRNPTKLENKKIYCGRGNTPEEAAKKYDAKARCLFGSDAVTNFNEVSA